MGKEVLFRTCVFGGYNKYDVNEYIKSLEDELAKARMLSEDGRMDSGYPAQGTAKREPDIVILDEIMGRDNSFQKESDPSAETASSLKQNKKDINTEQPIKNEAFELEKKRYEKEVRDLQLKCQNLQNEIEMLNREKNAYDEDYKAVKNVLLNARVDAEIIVAKAREKAKMLLDNAHKELEDKRRESYTLFSKCMEDNQNSLNISKVYLEQQIRQIEQVQKEMRLLGEKAKASDNVNKKE